MGRVGVSILGPDRNIGSPTVCNLGVFRGKRTDEVVTELLFIMWLTRPATLPVLPTRTRDPVSVGSGKALCTGCFDGKGPLPLVPPLSSVPFKGTLEC